MPRHVFAGLAASCQRGAGGVSGARETLRRLLSEAQRAVVFTGAGISTESGIADFRSSGGIWSRFAPIDFRDFLASAEARRESWRRRLALEPQFAAATPNRGHRAVARMVARGQVGCVVTQNVDGLHQQSGVPEARLVELHGNTTYAHCLNCANRFDVPPILERFAADGQAPTCNECGGLVKTATISFGQAMPRAAMARAREETLRCDLFLAVGSSLVVYPAAGFPALAKKCGATVVIVNREATEQDAVADVRVQGEIGEILGEAVGVD